MQRARTSRHLRDHRAEWLALHGDTGSAVLAALEKHGPMSKNLLFVAIPDKQPATVSRMVNRMLCTGVLAVEARGAIEVFRAVDRQ